MFSGGGGGGGGGSVPFVKMAFWYYYCYSLYFQEFCCLTPLRGWRKFESVVEPLYTKAFGTIKVASRPNFLLLKLKLQGNWFSGGIGIGLSESTNSSSFSHCTGWCVTILAISIISLPDTTSARCHIVVKPFLWPVACACLTFPLFHRCIHCCCLPHTLYLFVSCKYVPLCSDYTSFLK